MTEPSGEIPVSVRQELSYTTARALGEGALGIGVVDYPHVEDSHTILMDLVEVVETGIGKYATTPEALERRKRSHEKGEVLEASPEMWDAFTGGIKAGDFDAVMNLSDET